MRLKNHNPIYFFKVNWLRRFNNIHLTLFSCNFLRTKKKLYYQTFSFSFLCLSFSFRKKQKNEKILRWLGLLFADWKMVEIFWWSVIIKVKVSYYSWYRLRNLLYGNMLESRAFATSFEFLTIQLMANIRLSSMFSYKRLRNGYHEFKWSEIYKELKR